MKRNSKTSNVLIVEDDVITSNKMAYGLRAYGHSVTEVTTIREALEYFSKATPDCMVLDILLPDGSGLKLIETAQIHNVGIICVSVSGELDDRVRALSLGADDFMCKPVANAELAVKLHNLAFRLRQKTSIKAPDRQLLSFGQYICDIEAKRVYLKTGEQVALTSGEFNILQVFLHRPMVCMSRERIIRLSGSRNDTGNDRTVDIMLTRLRKKLEENPKAPELFCTVFGEGYMFATRPHTLAVNDNVVLGG